MILTSLTKFRDFGLLLFRLGFGLSFAFAWGWPKLAGGPAAWAKVGGAMKLLHIGFAPAMWGFLAAFSECIGALFFAAGFLFRPASGLLCFTMAVATLVNLNGEGGLPKAWQTIHYALLFFCFLFIGPGKYSVDKN